MCSTGIATCSESFSSLLSRRPLFSLLPTAWTTHDKRLVLSRSLDLSRAALFFPQFQFDRSSRCDPKPTSTHLEIYPSSFSPSPSGSTPQKAVRQLASSLQIRKMASLRHQSGPASLFETTPGGGLDLDSLTPSAQANTTSTIDAIADVSAIANAPAAASEVLPTSASSPHQRDLGPTTASLNGDLGRNSEEEPITSPRASPSTNNINTLAAAAGGIHHASLPHHNNDPAAAVAVPSPGAESIRITTTPHSHTAGTTTSSSPPPTFTPPPPPVNSTSTSTSETSTSGLAATGIRTPSPETIPMPVPFPFSSASRHHSSSSSNLLAHPVPSSSSSHPSPYYHNTSHQPQQQNEPLQIILTSDRLICRGVAGNLEPALLSGHVVLNLTEATNIKDISLNLVGKARIPTGEKASSYVFVFIFFAS